MTLFAACNLAEINSCNPTHLQGVSAKAKPCRNAFLQGEPGPRGKANVCRGCSFAGIVSATLSATLHRLSFEPLCTNTPHSLEWGFLQGGEKAHKGERETQENHRATRANQ